MTEIWKSLNESQMNLDLDHNFNVQTQIIL